MPTTAGRIYLGETLVAGGDPAPAPATWVRNPSWPACDAPSGSNKIVGLYAVHPGDGVGNGGNFFAMTIAGAYTIDYGDGTTTNYTSGSTAYYEFNYNDADLAGTDAPVTLTDAGDLVTRAAHGYTDGMTVIFYNIVTTTGITASTRYYVINATANTFQVAATSGGSAVVLTNDGTATLLPYKIATVTITPQVGSDLTSVNFLVKHDQAGLVDGYSTGWLDIAIAGASITSLTLGSATGTPVRFGWLERAVINQLGGITAMANLFRNCTALQSVTIADTVNTVTNMESMFASCSALQSVPLFNTASVTTMASMFSNCSSLTSVPLFNTASVTSMASMFTTCRSLTSVPLFNTASVTSMFAMFGTCSSLTSVPLFNTASVTSMASMFSSCVALTSVPLFNTASVTTMDSMFSNCSSLTSVPLFNTASVTAMASMFSFCRSLASVPAFVTTAVISAGLSSIFSNCNSITRIQAKDFRFTFSVANCKLSAAALDEIYTNLPTVTGQTITVTGNYGTAGDDPTIATAKGWTVTG